MKVFSHLPSMKRLVGAALAGMWLAISGCATFHEDTCAQFEERRKDTAYDTQYRFSESDSETAAHNFKPMPRHAGAVVRLYKMHVDQPRIKPCHNLTIRKEVYLQRTTGTTMVLEEVREFYTAHGDLIASKTEILSDQLRTSGYYLGDTPLPIPQNAPPGKYRIVSKLVMKTKGKKTRSVMLARTSARFQVLALDKK
ncbi:MAG: hypothetical protein ACM3NI_09345 [Bacteroidota bacterium]